MDKTEESRELVGAMQEKSAFDYGTADIYVGNSLTERTPATTSHSHSCSLNMSSADGKTLGSEKESGHKLCLCKEKDGVCYCGQKRPGIQLEPWSPMKSIALLSTMVFLAVWVIVIASLGAKNKL